MTLINLKRINKHAGRYYINDVSLTVDMMYLLLFLYDVERAGISYSSTWIKMDRLIKKGLVEQVITEDEVTYKLNSQAKLIIKELLK